MLPKQMPYSDDAHEIEQLQQLFQLQKTAFQQHSYPNFAERKLHLSALKQMLVEYQEQIKHSISEDFSNRSHSETEMFELMTSILGIKHTIKQLKTWMKPEKRHVHVLFQPATASVHYQPLGVVGIIVPWNYPLFLAIGPLTQALAAGNRVILKMSEYTPKFAALFKTLLAKFFPEDLVAVVNGDAKLAAAFSALPFDHLLFTGSTHIGRHVMKAAAEHLTPVTLELGGKSPALIAEDANIYETARRIAFGKAMNAGQTCVAPDYVLIPSALQSRFIEEYTRALNTFFPTSQDNPDYTAIISDRQLQRLKHYLDDAAQHGAKIQQITATASDRRLPHYVITDVTDDMNVMKEEIFGPILPILTYTHIDEAIAYINQHDRPLALYYFGYNKRQQQHVLAHTHSGGVCLNETLLHVGQEDLPFGGVGASGMGAYHGHEGFKTFSHAKAVFDRPKFSLMRLFYPPYNTAIQRFILKLFIR